ncbi:DUF3618 domain-containing protein [Amycolatopsis rhabdoformis]|uniref:DUF3618 domain-containing protein n=1 Tax=Amycolatopsis rhabdoformis TaxID=1448059 RepID=A0ABZ1IIA9_9PSEU|nr:DUF3618 domain-containing protein [Amycolatopsis rhabdoformis]WSE33274.1 DUF3618 domain-containing protein [Amycolatopsis rhabdoformis]
MNRETPEEVRVDRDATRAELAQTLDDLEQKLDVRPKIKQGLDNRLDQAEEKVGSVVGKPTAAKVRQGADTVRANPVPVFASLLGLLIVLRIILRRRSHDDG